MRGESSERRWLMLGTDGRHTCVGRATDPTESEVSRTEAVLAAGGLSGWLAVFAGDYWGPGDVALFVARPLGAPPGDGWDAAVAAFRAHREVALPPRREGQGSP